MKLTCQCRKKNGEFCTRKAKSLKYCWQHKQLKVNQMVEGEPRPISVEPRHSVNPFTSNYDPFSPDDNNTATTTTESLPPQTHTTNQLLDILKCIPPTPSTTTMPYNHHESNDTLPKRLSFGLSTMSSL